MVKKTSETEQKKLLEKFAASGMAKKDFARAKNLDLNQFYYWFKKHNPDEFVLKKMRSMTAHQKQELIEKFKASGGTEEEFCEANGLLPEEFKFWLANYDRRGDTLSGYDKDEILREYEESSFTLPRFAKEKNIPYMALKKLVKESDPEGKLANKPSEERLIIIEEFYASGKSEQEFAEERGLDKTVFAEWLANYQSGKKVKDRLSENAKRGLVEEFATSEMTMKDFAESKNITPETFGSWLKKYDPDKKLTANAGRWALVHKRQKELAREFLQSNLTQREFAKRKGVSEVSISLWLKKYYPDKKL